MTTLEEARALAALVVAGKPRSHVEAAGVLARFVLALPVPVVHAETCALENDDGHPASRGLGCDCGAEERAKAI